jgi:hypothetical protein
MTILQQQQLRACDERFDLAKSAHKSRKPLSNCNFDAVAETVGQLRGNRWASTGNFAVTPALRAA